MQVYTITYRHDHKTRTNPFSNKVTYATRYTKKLTQFYKDNRKPKRAHHACIHISCIYIYHIHAYIHAVSIFEHIRWSRNCSGTQSPHYHHRQRSVRKIYIGSPVPAFAACPSIIDPGIKHFGRSSQPLCETPPPSSPQHSPCPKVSLMSAQVLHYAVLVQREAWHPRGRLSWNAEVSFGFPAKYGFQCSCCKCCRASVA